MIFLRSTLLRVNSSHNPVVPLNYFHLSLSVSTSTEESSILNERPSFSYTVSSVEMAAAAVGEIWQYVGTSYGADILPTGRPCISLDKIINITIIIVVVVVTDFSDSEPRPRRLVYRRSGGNGDRFRLRPDFEMSRCQRRRRQRRLFHHFLLLLFLLLLLLLRVGFSKGGCGF